MREILFRAKTIDTESKWVEGFYAHVPNGRFLCDEHMIQTIAEDGRIGQLYDVYESTVGQFTGLTDKHGRKIFEGDILEYCSPRRVGNPHISRHVVEWGGHRWERKTIWACDWTLDWNCKYHASDLYPEITAKYAEVIGNIHDNLKLLEGGE